MDVIVNLQAAVTITAGLAGARQLRPIHKNKNPQVINRRSAFVGTQGEETLRAFQMAFNKFKAAKFYRVKYNKYVLYMT